MNTAFENDLPNRSIDVACKSEVSSGAVKTQWRNTLKRFNAVDVASDLFCGEHINIRKCEVLDYYYLFGCTTSTYAMRFVLKGRICSTDQIHWGFEVLVDELRGRNLLLHISYPINVSARAITNSMKLIQSTYPTADREIVIIPTKKKRIKFWQVKLYVFEEKYD